MCQQLTQFRHDTIRYAAGFEPARLTLADARAFVVGATVIVNSWAAMLALAAARVAECGDQRPQGRRQTAEELARTAGVSLGAARNTVEVGQRMRDQPKVSAAARRGDLSPTQTAAITDATNADPTAEDRLVEQAANSSVSELYDECARTKAAAEPDPDRRHADIRAKRSLRSWTDTGGVGHLGADGTVDDIAQIMAAVQSRAGRLFDQARRDGRREPIEAYAFDALLELALESTSSHPTARPGAAPGGGDEATAGAAGGDRAKAEPAKGDAADREGPIRVAPGGDTLCAGRERTETEPDSPGHGDAERPDNDGGPTAAASLIAVSGGAGSRSPASGRPRVGAPVRLNLSVDLDAWLRGFPIEDETCELVGHGPVPMSVVRKLLAQGDPFVVAILTKCKAVVGVTHLGRKPTAYQQSAVEWLYPSCAVQGCSAKAHLQIDHRTDWAKTHFTMLDWLDRLCIHHHNRKTRDNWALVDGIGKRPFVPPDDPRHPRHTQPRHQPSTNPPPTAA